MTVTTSTPVILLSDKLMTITNLTTLVPVKLDIDEMNYSSWVYFFKNLCKGHEILKHILGEPTDEATSSNPSPPTAEWLKIDYIVLSWIFMTLSKTLQQRICVEDPQTAKEDWDLIALIFKENKHTRSIVLKAELRSLKLGDLSIDAYFCKIESIDTILTSLGSPIRYNGNNQLGQTSAGSCHLSATNAGQPSFGQPAQLISQHASMVQAGQSTTLGHSGLNLASHETLLPNTFNAMTLQDPTSGN
ncbi:hypothetical protein Tco_0843661 [Tanacetum coccineum]|uniref:Hybrid signal transduction histidine kinase M n=1 Tax=Tanacetum coccineum TaxID=301880 RepID=A0ABQ5B4K8_9ASTR